MQKTLEEKYEADLMQVVQFFKNNRELKSACLGTFFLNSEGLRHLIYKSDRHKRDLKNQITRFDLLPYIKEVLAGMKYYQEYCCFHKLVEVKRNKSILLEKKKIQYWSFVAVVNDRVRVKYILKKIGEGNIILWSVIPAWKIKGYKDGFADYILHNGDLEED